MSVSGSVSYIHRGDGHSAIPFIHKKAKGFKITDHGSISTGECSQTHANTRLLIFNRTPTVHQRHTEEPWYVPILPSTCLADLLRLAQSDNAEYKEAFALFDKRGTGAVPRETLGDLLRAVGQNPTQAEVSDLVSSAPREGVP